MFSFFKHEIGNVEISFQYCKWNISATWNKIKRNLTRNLVLLILFPTRNVFVLVKLTIFLARNDWRDISREIYFSCEADQIWRDIYIFLIPSMIVAEISSIWNVPVIIGAYLFSVMLQVELIQNFTSSRIFELKLIPKCLLKYFRYDLCKLIKCFNYHHHGTLSMDFPDPSSPLVSIVHRSLQVFKAASYISTELL